MIVSFIVDGPPRPWSRAVRGTNRQTGKPIMLTPKGMRVYKSAIAMAGVAGRARASVASGGTWPMDAHYRVELWIAFADERRRDLDNVAKSYLDALIGVLWNDDSQVKALSIDSCVDPECPLVQVKVEIRCKPTTTTENAKPTMTRATNVTAKLRQRTRETSSSRSPRRA